jgi:LmbE family N-acetylglucosaminyl deacetylase
VARLTLVLSPHLDDAVLSCSSLMASRRSLIATFFTAGDASYEARRAEDFEAAKILGASARHLGFRDAPFRSVLYRSFLGIVAGPADPLLKVEKALAGLLEELDPELVLAPLGVGNHVDHRLLRNAAAKLVRPERLLFYEDLPYAFVKDQIDFTVGTAPAPDWDSYFAAHYVQTYLAGTAPEAVKKAFAASKPFYFVEPARQFPPPPLAALGAYKTQLNDLFATPAAMAALYASRPERYWARTPA